MLLACVNIRETSPLRNCEHCPHLGTADQRECDHVHVLLALVLEQLGLAGILLVAQTAVMRLRGHAAHHVREGRVGLSRDAGHATLEGHAVCAFALSLVVYLLPAPSLTSSLRMGFIPSQHYI